MSFNILKARSTGLYWTARGVWTENPREELLFLDDVRATDYAFYHDIPRARTMTLDENRLYAQSVGSNRNHCIEQARELIVFKLLVNDQIWAQGHDCSVAPGESLELAPLF